MMTGGLAFGRQTDTKKRKRKKVCSGYFMATLDQRGEKNHAPAHLFRAIFANSNAKNLFKLFFRALEQLAVPESALPSCRIFFLFHRGALCICSDKERAAEHLLRENDDIACK